MSFTYICEHCDNSFTVPRQRKQTSKHIFCSKQCSADYRTNLRFLDAKNKLKEPEFWYWFGFIMADGTIYTDRDGYYIVKVAISIKDIEHLRKFTLYFGGVVTVLNKYNRCETRIQDKSLIELMMYRGLCRNKTYQGFNLDKIPLNMVHHFIRGYFDGDGSIHLNKISKQLQFCIASYKQEVLNSVAEYLPIDVGIYHYKNCYTLCKNGNKNCQILYDFLYKDDCISLNRKKSIFERVVDTSLR